MDDEQLHREFDWFANAQVQVGELPRGRAFEDVWPGTRTKARTRPLDPRGRHS